jgi:hypothetical protein
VAVRSNARAMWEIASKAMTGSSVMARHTTARIFVNEAQGSTRRPRLALTKGWRADDLSVRHPSTRARWRRMSIGFNPAVLGSGRR